MIGGYYVLSTWQDKPGRVLVTLIAGPFDTWEGANRAGPLAINYAEKNFGNTADKAWTICEFYAPELVPGVLNKELWVTPTPAKR